MRQDVVEKFAKEGHNRVALLSLIVLPEATQSDFHGAERDREIEPLSNQVIDDEE